LPARIDELVELLERTKNRFGAVERATRREVLATLARGRIREPDLLLRYHEALCFLRAYPDGPGTLDVVEEALAAIPARVAALRHPERLDETGMAGTTLYCPLSYAAARWLATCFPDAVELDWQDAETETAAGTLLPWLSGLAAEEALVEVGVPYREWLAAVRGPRPGSDLAAILDGLAGGPDAGARQAAYDALAVRTRWRLGSGPASRTRLRLPAPRIFFHRGPLRRVRGRLRRWLPGAPVAVRQAAPDEATALLDAARAAVLFRYREVHAFNFADPADVRMADLGRGVQIAWFGLLPVHRLPLRAHYGYLVLKNALPVGYGDASLLFERVELAYNVFETFRQGESAFIFVRLLAFLGQHLGVRVVSLSRYQIGYQNDEALDSGAFWFYDKLGFRSEQPDIARLATSERQRIRAEPGYRSPRATLARLSEAGMIATLAPGRATALDVRRLGLRAAAAVAGPHASPASLAARMAQALGAGRWRAWPPPERLALERLAPVLALIPDLGTWPPRERRALVEVIRAKGGTGEAGYLRRLRGHRRLRRWLVELAGETPRQSGTSRPPPQPPPV
jgi:hypothetical protein